MSKECDNFGEFFVYRLENILTKNLKKDTNRLFSLHKFINSQDERHDLESE